MKLWLTHPVLAGSLCGIINLVNERFMFASDEVQEMLDACAFHSSSTLFLCSCFNQEVLEAQLSDASEREKALEKQLQAVRDAGRERDRDFITLNTVLQCNQDVINVSQTNSALIQQYTHMFT